MFPFKQTFPTPKENTPWINKKKYIITHHTWSWKGTAKWVINWLAYRDDFASCHFFIDEFGDAYKFGSPDDILWHAWVSQWGTDKNINTMSLGIEVQWPLGWKWKENFTDAQRKTLRLLIQHLMAVFKIPNKNVLRHADLTWWGSSDRFFWDWVSKSRKIDPSPDLWKIDRTTWKQYQDSLVPKEI
jgi:N-acetylmuramoyl-L-alanine amidase